MFRIKFESYLGYQNFDESDRLNSLDYFPVNTREWCLFKSNNSDYIDRVMKETAGKYDAGEIIHFAIVTSNDIIDILALKEPIVEDL
jgi:hypothetical protein